MTSRDFYNLIFLILLSTTGAAAQTEYKEHLLDSVSVVGHTYTSPISGLGNSIIRWDMSSFDALPQILSNANPLRFAQYLPGIQTSSDFDTGLHFYGCDDAHNQYSIDGIPVYNPSHLMGFFSTFSSGHFKDMLISKTASAAHQSNRLGGMIDMQSHSLVDSLSGNVSVGFISSQGTVHMPLGRYASMSLSGRVSYLNWLYSPWLKLDDNELQYGFDDLNLSMIVQPSPSDQLLLSAYYGGDDLLLKEMSDNQLKWGNKLIGVTWKHSFENARFELKNYLSDYKNSLLLNESAYQFDLNARLRDIATQARLFYGDFTLGFDYIHHRFKPLNRIQKSHETSVSVDWEHAVTKNIELALGLKVSDYYLEDKENQNWVSADPMGSVKYTAPYGGIFSVSYALRHQYLLQSGISQLGLPIEFWMSSTREKKPQYGHTVTLKHDIILPNNKWQITTELFYKKLYHQKEFIGTGLNLVSKDNMEIYDQIADGEGHNYGFNLIVNKRSGALRGWICYTWNRALRDFDRVNYTFHATHERRHELNALATYQLSEKAEFSGTFVLADGTPFTAPDYFYLLNGRLISHFSDYNGNRLPAYHRLDLSFTWHLAKRGKVNQELNLSVYNVYGHDNFSFYRLKVYKGRFGYRPLCMVGFPLPSISYNIKF